MLTNFFTEFLCIYTTIPQSLYIISNTMSNTKYIHNYIVFWLEGAEQATSWNMQ